MLRFALVGWLLLVSAAPLVAQRLARSPERYARSVDAMLTGTDQVEAMQVGERFVNAWGNFSASQQQQIMEMTRYMENNRYRVIPLFRDFFDLMAAADSAGLRAGRFDDLLKVSRHVLGKNTRQEFSSFMQVSRQFLLDRNIYASSYNRLVTGEGNFAFVLAEPEAAPAAPKETAPPAEDDPFADDPFADDPFATFDETAPITFDEVAAADQQVVLSADYPEVEVTLAEGPAIRLDGVDLTFMTGFDTTVIENTSGYYLFNQKEFVGRGGRFDWRVAGLPEVYAELQDYSFAVRNPQFRADKVKLYHPERLAEPAVGFMEFKSHEAKDFADASYPRFRSHEADVKVRNIGKDILYRGGFSMRGQHIGSASFSRQPSVIEVERGGRTYFRALSNNFSLSDTLVEAPSAYTAMYFDEDSVFHPGRRLSYQPQEYLLKLYENRDLYRNSPYIDTYHNLEMHCDVASWSLDSTNIEFYTISARDVVPASFESISYYSPGRFLRLQGLNNFHPIVMLVGYYTETKEKSFYADDMARRFNRKPETVRNMLNSLQADGYVDYNPRTGLVQLNQKTIHYFLSNRKKKDFDQMIIESVTPSGKNGVLNLDSRELSLQGVGRFYLSDSLGVYIEPDSQRVRVLKNRQVIFDGKLNAGRYQAYGKDFDFSYSEFAVELTEIDSMIVSIENEDGTNSRTVLESGSGNVTTGTLYINDPKNKSGRRKLPQYPIFEMTSPSFVYFDGPDVNGGGMYDRDFYFNIPPFRVDSMTSASAASFEGRFVSDNIFPEFEEELTVQPDGKLGFQRTTPPNGLPIYGTSARFVGDVSLNSRGLRGAGEVRYFTSVFKSDDFIFYQDSLVASGENLRIEAGEMDGASFPEVVASRYDMHWKPYQDSLIITPPEDRQLDLYGETAQLDGELVLSSSGTAGAGILTTRGALIDAPSYRFGPNNFSGDSAYFEVKSNSPLKPAFLSRDVAFSFDLSAGRAEFTPEVSGEAVNEFPFAQYRTSIPKAVWNLNERTIEMAKPEEEDLTTSYFYSTNPEQDSLNFYATNAVYQIDDYRLVVGGVPYIQSVDAKIIPDKNEVVIYENAEMELLENATVVLDTLSEYHRLTEGDIKINGRNSFAGQATYQYEGADEKFTPIEFSAFEFVDYEPEERRQKKDTIKYRYTYAEGLVSDDQPLTIIPGVLYRGDATMRANQSQLVFDGEIKLDITSGDVTSSWVKYAPETSDDSTEVFSINLNSLTSSNGKVLHTGLAIEDGASDLYFSLVSEHKTSNDQQVFEVKDLLTFDIEEKVFVIGDAGKQRGETFAGDVLIFNDQEHAIEYSGRFHFLNPNEPNNNFRLFAAGSGSGDLDEQVYDFNTMLVLNADIPPAALKVMSERMVDRALTIGLPPAVEDRTELMYKIGDLMGEKAAQDYYETSAMEYMPIFKLGGMMERGILMPEVKLRWSPENQAWYSIGRVGLSSVLDFDVDASLEGYVEIKKLYDNEIVNIYLEASPDTWYYFTFDEAKRLGVVSSDPAFNDIIGSKASKARPGEFHLDAASPLERAQFIERFNEQYYGKQVEVLVEESEPQVPSGVGDEPAASEDDAFGSDPFADEVPPADADPFADDPVADDDPFADPPADRKDKKSRAKKKKDEDTPPPATATEPPPKPPVDEEEEDGF